MKGTLIATLPLLAIACSAQGATEPAGAAASPTATASVAELSGTWKGTVTTSACTGSVSVQLVLDSAGTFAQQSTCDVTASTLRGPWTIAGASLRLDVADWEPKQFCGPLGCTDIVKPAAETHDYKLDGDTLVLTNAYCPADPACTVTYKRNAP